MILLMMSFDICFVLVDCKGLLKDALVTMPPSHCCMISEHTKLIVPVTCPHPQPLVSELIWSEVLHLFLPVSLAARKWPYDPIVEMYVFHQYSFIGSDHAGLHEGHIQCVRTYICMLRTYENMYPIALVLVWLYCWSGIGDSYSFVIIVYDKMAD